MPQKSCYLAAPKKIPAERLALFTRALQRETEQAIADGYNIFICGLDTQADLLFAQLVLAQSRKHPHVHLEGALACGSRARSKNPLFRRCLAACSGVFAHQQAYTIGCEEKHDRSVISLCSRLIAIYNDHPRRGVRTAIRCAQELQKEVRKVSLLQ